MSSTCIDINILHGMNIDFMDSLTTNEINSPSLRILVW